MLFQCFNFSVWALNLWTRGCTCHSPVTRMCSNAELCDVHMHMHMHMHMPVCAKGFPELESRCASQTPRTARACLAYWYMSQLHAGSQSTGGGLYGGHHQSTSCLYASPPSMSSHTYFTTKWFRDWMLGVDCVWIWWDVWRVVLEEHLSVCSSKGFW
jgi:hypothetical protein